MLETDHHFMYIIIEEKFFHRTMSLLRQVNKQEFQGGRLWISQIDSYHNDLVSITICENILWYCLSTYVTTVILNVSCRKTYVIKWILKWFVYKQISSYLHCTSSNCTNTRLCNNGFENVNKNFFLMTKNALKIDGKT